MIFLMIWPNVDRLVLCFFYDWAKLLGNNLGNFSVDLGLTKCLVWMLVAYFFEIWCFLLEKLTYAC